MLIGPQSAERLCQSVVSHFLNWRALWAALQSGGLEHKGRGRFADAIENWLVDYERSELIVLPEYRKAGYIDFSLIDPLSLGRAQLSIDTLFEVKFNYAWQCVGQIRGQEGGEIGKQIRKAIRQTGYYRSNGRRLLNGIQQDSDAYVMHLVAAPVADVVQETQCRDTGWRYFNSPLMEAAQATIVNVAAEDQWAILGGHYSAPIYPRSPLLYCCILNRMA